MAEGTAVLDWVESTDGTRIAYRRSGSGAPLVLAHGTTSAHWSFRLLVPLLVDRFTVCAIDRRGRGDSEDGPEYAIEREFDDVAGLVDSIAEPASLFGHSYGATVALGAALRARNLRKLVLYEPAPGIPAVPADDVERIESFAAAGRREDAVVHAFRSFGMSAEELEQLRGSPTWPARVEAAHTIAREIRAEETCDFDPNALRRLTVPVLLLLGEESPDWAREGTERLHDALPDARVAVLHGEGHLAIVTAPDLVAHELDAFLPG